MIDLRILFPALLFAIIVMASFAPIEALGWWAGWFPEKEDEEQGSPKKSDKDCFVVFLTGIHSVSETTYARREIKLLDRLEHKLPNCEVIEVFPYSPSNRSLTGDRFFAWFWKTALRLKMNKLFLAGLLINIRNIFQVVVSADSRYGPIYNQGMAESIYKSLLSHGYSKADKAPIIIIGYSGGGQIAVAAAGPLYDLSKAEISVISLGGIIASEPSLDKIKTLYHLIGKKDKVHNIGRIFFPGRWPIIRYSAWNRAKAKAKIKFVDMGPPDHTGKNGYLDGKAKLANGQTYFEHTVEVITKIIQAIINDDQSSSEESKEILRQNKPEKPLFLNSK